MLKVIIVDDEALIRIGIKSCIDWESHGFKLVGQAEDGGKAIELIKMVHPDIVITDIRMPNKDGLEVLDFIRANYPEIKTVVLSCHNDIDFVKKAIKLGAEDYSVKLSMGPENLFEVLGRLRLSIENEKRDIPEAADKKQEIKRNVIPIKEDLYKQLILESMSPKNHLREIKKTGVEFIYNNFIVLCCEIDDFSAALLKSQISDRHLFKISFINIVEECMTNYCKGDTANIDGSRYVIVLNYPDQYDTEKIMEVTKDFCNKVNSVLKMYLNYSISFGISDAFEGYKEIINNYKKASFALKYKFYHGRESIIFYKDTVIFNNEDIVFDSKDERELLSSLERLDSEGAKEVIKKFINSFDSLKGFDPAKIKKAAVLILHSLFMFASQCRIGAELAYLQGKEYFFDIAIKDETIEDIKCWFDTFLDQFIQCLANTERWEIVQIKQYISENVEENITLDKAAKMCNISKCYFSSIFKKVTNENFTDYLNRAKMLRAKELIQEEGLKTYEAAFRVGIENESYFSKLFKKHIGINPSAIRRSNIKSKDNA